MSLFKEFELTGTVYHKIDNNKTKTGAFSSTPAFTILLNVIRRNEDAVALLGEEVGEYAVFVNGGYANASNIVRGDKIVVDSRSYIVANRPRFVKLFNRYKLVLKSND